MTGPARKRVIELCAQFGRQFRRIRSLAQRQRTMWRENRGEHHNGWRLITLVKSPAKGSTRHPLFGDSLPRKG